MRTAIQMRMNLVCVSMESLESHVLASALIFPVLLIHSCVISVNVTCENCTYKNEEQCMWIANYTRESITCNGKSLYL